MKRMTFRFLSVTLSLVVLCFPMPALATGALKSGSAVMQHSPRVSDRLIVKLKTNATSIIGVNKSNAFTESPLSAQELSQINTAAGAAISEHHRMSTGAHVLSLPGAPNKSGMAQAIAAISKLPNVEYVEEDTIETALFIPNDPQYLVFPMWGMQPVSPAGVTPSTGSIGSYGADFQSAWDYSSGLNVVVAVVDTGITPHIDIGGPNALVTSGTGSNLISSGYTFISDCRMIDPTADPVHGCTATSSTYILAPFSGALDTGDFISSADSTTLGSAFNGLAQSNSSWHGTFVAGIIAAIGNNGLTVIGGAYKAKLLPVRVLGKGGGYLSDVSEGLLWAAGVHPTIPNPHPAKVINLSVGGTGPCGSTQQNAIDAVVAAGSVVVVAAGNDGTDAATVHPSSCNNVISVAAIARDGRRAIYSNFSSGVPATITLGAPGGDFTDGIDPGIVSTINSGTTTPIMDLSNAWPGFAEGTSMAAPHVAAAAALMLARNPSLTPAQIKSILTAPTSVTAFPSFVAGLSTTDCALNNNCGAGILNAKLAVQNTPTATPAPATGSSGGGGGGCAIIPTSANPDVSLLLVMLAVAAYRLRCRVFCDRSAD